MRILFGCCCLVVGLLHLYVPNELPIKHSDLSLLWIGMSMTLTFIKDK